MQTLYSIGDVSRLSGVPVSTLRYYADMGILIPEKVDEHSGYRYYSFDDIRRLESVGYLKKAGLSLTEIARIMGSHSDDERSDILNSHYHKIQHKMALLEEKMSMMAWLWQQEKHPDGEEENGYRIRQKSFEMRRILVAEAPEPCLPEQMYAQANRQWQEMAIAPDQKMTGYLIDETSFMQDKRLYLDGEFLVPDEGMNPTQDNLAFYMLPKGNYICMTTPIFKDDRWIRVLSRYFAERDSRPRNILALRIRRDLIDWRQSLYEVQILI